MVVLGGAFVKTFGRTATSIYPSSAANTHSIDCLDLQGKEREREMELRVGIILQFVVRLPIKLGMPNESS